MSVCGQLRAKRRGQTSGCAFMIAMRRVRCGSSVYVQKKSCSWTSSGGVVSAGGEVELRNRVVLVSLGELEVVVVEVEAGMLNDCMPACE